MVELILCHRLTKMIAMEGFFLSRCNSDIFQNNNQIIDEVIFNWSKSKFSDKQTILPISASQFLYMGYVGICCLHIVLSFFYTRLITFQAQCTLIIGWKRSNKSEVI